MHDTRGVPTSGLLLLCVVTTAGAACVHRPARPPAVDPSARLEEQRQRSVTEDPAAMGRFPDGWLVPPAEPPVTQESPAKELEDDEIEQFAERFKGAKAADVLDAELPPGATRTVELQLDGPAGLAGSVQWIGTAAPLRTTLAVDGSRLDAGKPYELGTERGGAYLRAQTPVGGRCTLTVANTSPVRVRVRVLLMATPR